MPTLDEWRRYFLEREAKAREREAAAREREAEARECRRKEHIRMFGWDYAATGPCEHPECHEARREGERAPVMTQYEWDGEGEDPNKPPILCPEHTKEWVDEWQERWDDYYSGLL